MLLLHVVPVGLSLLDRIEQPVLATDELPASVLTVRDALRWAGGQTGELDWERLGLPAARRATLAATPTAAAAEWTSLAAVTDDRRYGAVRGEAYVLLATDTDDGLRAATLVAARYPSTRVRYLDEPLAARGTGLEPGDAYLCRIPHLNLGIVPPTSGTWRSLGAAGRLVADAATQTGRGEWTVIVHLSGGYKAMVPYLMVLAEGIHTRLRALPPDAAHRPVIRAVAVHESSLDQRHSERPIVIDIPVRAIEGDLLTQTRTLAQHTHADSDVVSAGIAEDLLGLFLERHGEHQRRLTAAGLIMVNVL